MTDDYWTAPTLDIERSSFSIAEFLEWDNDNKLELSPEFQRGEVWRNPAKAYLIDTILRDFPIPPLHIRMVHREGRGIVREVIDGQQRLTAVLQYIRGRYALGQPRVGTEDPAPWAGLRYRELPRFYQDRILNYSFRCEVYRGNIADSLVHEIFSRINIHSIPLSDQELRNGKFFGEFKQAVYGLAREHRPFFLAASLFTNQAIARMLDTQFVSEALVLQLSGMQDKKSSIDSFYARYDSSWDERDIHERRFRSCIDSIRQSCGEVLSQTRFRRIPLFYTLYAVVYHRLFGIEEQRIPDRMQPLPPSPRKPLTEKEQDQLRNTIEVLSTLIEKPDSAGPLTDFVVATNRQTDNIRPRMTRFYTLWEVARLSNK